MVTVRTARGRSRIVAYRDRRSLSAESTAKRQREWWLAAIGDHRQAAGATSP